MPFLWHGNYLTKLKKRLSSDFLSVSLCNHSVIPFAHGTKNPSPSLHTNVDVLRILESTTEEQYLRRWEEYNDSLLHMRSLHHHHIEKQGLKQAVEVRENPLT